MSFRAIMQSQHPYIIGVAISDILKKRVFSRRSTFLFNSDDIVKSISVTGELCGYAFYAFSKVIALERDEFSDAFLLGASQEESTYDLLGASGSEFENNDMGILGQARKDYGVQGEKTRSGLRSVFGRVNYSWKMRYMLMASFRYDGSSRFADGNQWGFFPSVSVGWNIANEPFWEDMKETVIIA